jgi:DNA-binding response OmpR family regulator
LPSIPSILLKGVPERNNNGKFAVATILVLDEEADSRMLLKRILQQDGHQVSTCGGLTEALELVRSGDPALVVVNMRSGGRSSDFWPSRLKTENPRVLILTIMDNLPGGSEVNEMYDEYLTRPVELNAIEAKVRNLLERKPAPGTP